MTFCASFFAVDREHKKKKKKKKKEEVEEERRDEGTTTNGSPEGEVERQRAEQEEECDDTKLRERKQPTINKRERPETREREERDLCRRRRTVGTVPEFVRRAFLLLDALKDAPRDETQVARVHALIAARFERARRGGRLYGAQPRRR